MGQIRVGIGGWVFAPWRGTFYPKGLAQARELSFASRQVSSIEINGTFYGAQKPASFKRWHDETPDDFVFSVKGPRFATHRRALAESASSVERFLASGVGELGGKLGPILWQFPATTKYEAENFAAFLARPKQASACWHGCGRCSTTSRQRSTRSTNSATARLATCASPCPGPSPLS